MHNYFMGYSPCPNDTFIFGGLATGLIRPSGFDLTICHHDVETLNSMALKGNLDISKLSFYAWLKVKSQYELLQCGAALGYGCGPLLIARKPMSKEQVIRSRIVLPGTLTTAHLLFRLWAPEAEDRIFVPYDQIFDMIVSDKADCGVIIHESRFTFEQAGYVAIVDLGQFWEQKTGTPIPLGCIAAKKELGKNTIEKLEAAIRTSIELARKSPEKILPYIREHAQEMDLAVLQQHIDTFVNEFSWDLGPLGKQAIAVLEENAHVAGILS
ncbi:MAG: 1,4-dihydroxy-6-naphthoate synthase [Desulfobacteraceae bacterium]|jgi:1,4-dihydroxy-6-naphthoate synthase